MIRRRFATVGMLALVGIGITRLTDPRVDAAKPPTYVGELKIDPQDGDGVFPDAVDLNGIYRDYQASPGDLKQFCVYGTVDASGMAFFGLDRRQGFSDDQWCNLHVDPSTGQFYTPRQYGLILGDDGACGYLFANEGGVVDSDRAPCTLISSVPGVPLNAKLQPHISAETVFKTKATKTPVIFDFTPSSGTALRVVMDQDATVTGTPNVRTVTYSGLAHLKYTAGATIGNSFPLKFHMIFTRVAI